MRTDAMPLRCVVVALAMAATTTWLPAQEWSLSLQAGRIRSALDPAAEATQNVAAGLRYDDSQAGLRLSAGVPTEARQALWGSVGAWRRVAVTHRGAVVGLDLGANAFATADRSIRSSGPIFNPLDPPPTPATDRSGHALAGQVLPVVGYEGARFQVHARAGVSRYTVSLGGQRGARTVRLGDLQATLHPTTQWAVIPVVRRYVAAGEKATTYAGASSVMAFSSGSLWGSIGQWSAGAGDGMPWAAGVRLRLHDLLALEGSARRDTHDPLYLQPAQTSWSVGVSVPLGRRRASAAAPVPAAYVNGHATVRLPVSESPAPPSIAGDFNEWKPAPMQRAGEHWTYTVALAPGVYHYAFVNDAGEWFVPERVPGRRSDGMGGHVAVLVVR